MTPCAAAESC